MPDVPQEAAFLADDVSASDRWVAEQLYAHALRHTDAPAWNVLVFVGAAHRLLPVALDQLGAHTQHAAVEGVHALLPQFFAAEAIRLSQDPAYVQASMTVAVRAAHIAWTVFNQLHIHRQEQKKVLLTGHEKLRTLSRIGNWAIAGYSKTLPSRSAYTKTSNAIRDRMLDPDLAIHAVQAANAYHDVLEQALRKHAHALIVAEAAHTRVLLKQPARTRQR